MYIPKILIGVLNTLLFAAFSTTAVSADAVDDLVRSRIAKLNVPGASVAVIRDGRLVRASGYGLANLETRTLARPGTVYEIGSIGKQFTATAILILAQEGKLRLSDSIRQYFPDAPASWGAITVRHLLTHTSGIQNHVAVPGYMDIFRISITGRPSPGTNELLKAFYELPIEFGPGETWAYDNTGYILLGHIIEKVSGRSYWQFIDERLFKPAGMLSTGPNRPEMVIQERASGYEWIGNKWERRMPLWPHVAFSAGAHVSTVEDFAKWLLALDSGKILSRENLEKMWTATPGPNGALLPVNYGFGWSMGRVAGFRQITHSGGTPGFSTTVHRFPERGLSVIIFANHADRMLEDIALDIAGIYDTRLKLTVRRDRNPELTARLRSIFRDLIAGKIDPANFTVPMQKHLATELGKGLPQWYASHGEMNSFDLVEEQQNDGARSLRYRVGLGNSRPYFTFALDSDEKIAQIFWW